MGRRLGWVESLCGKKIREAEIRRGRMLGWARSYAWTENHVSLSPGVVNKMQWKNKYGMLGAPCEI